MAAFTLETDVQMKTLILCFTLLLPAVGFAQQYSIDWYKISGGGGTSTGATYQVTGTIGQADAGSAMSGGQYSLTCGFWSLIAVVQTATAPSLAVTCSGSSVIVSWPYPSTGWTLQQNASVANASGWQTSPYTITTTGSTNSITITVPTGSLFFHLAK